jgi:hypothetical protein
MLVVVDLNGVMTVIEVELTIWGSSPTRGAARSHKLEPVATRFLVPHRDSEHTVHPAVHRDAHYVNVACRI